MSETMSGQSDQWIQFYQQNQVAPPGHHRTMVGSSGNRVSDATVVTTTVTTSASPPSQLGSGNSSPGGGHLSPEGRVSKPIRRRSRASRRTPTTLLNTDTTNFRAMVQQFTGGPSAPFGSAGTNPSFNFGLGSGRQAVHVNPTAMMMGPGGTVGYHHLQPHQQQHLYQQANQQPQQYMFSLNNNNTPGPGDHAFLQRLGSTRPTNMGMLGAVSDHHGFGMDGDPSSSQVVPPGAAARPSSNPTNENRSNSFLF